MKKSTKRTITVGGLAGLVSGTASVEGAVIFQQDFSSSTTVSSYVNATTPTTGQFTQIASTSGSSVAITSGALALTRSSGGSSNFKRSIAFSGPPTEMYYKMDIAVSGNSTAATGVGIFYIGSGTGTNAFANDNVSPSNANSYARLGIDFTTTNGTYNVRNMTASASTATTFSGTNTIHWFLNNTGASRTYLGPNGASQTLANDTADIWVGNTRYFDDVAVQTATNSLSNIAFFSQGTTGTISIDNITINDALPAVGVTLPTAFTVTPASGTRTAGQTVVVANASATSPDTRDSGTLSGLTIASANGTFSQSGLANGSIAAGASQTGTISLTAGSNVLKGAVPRGTLSFTLAGGTTSGATGTGNYSYSLTASAVTTNSAPVNNSNSFSAFATAQTASVLAGTDAYTGLESSATGSLVGSGGGTRLGSVATILKGDASAATTVSMAWRTRTTTEVPPQSASLLFPESGGLASDVVSLTGIAASGGGSIDGSVQTDIFVLQMTYDEAAVTIMTGLSESAAAAAGLISLGYLDLGSDGVTGGTGLAADTWKAAVAGNFGGTATFVPGNTTWVDFGSPGLADDLGRYGVNTATNTVWAVLNHNSQFAVIPEPSTFGLMGVSMLGAVVRRRRRGE